MEAYIKSFPYLKDLFLLRKSLLFLFLFLSGLLFPGFSCDFWRVTEPQPLPPPGPICNADTDCVLVNRGCCGCDYGEGDFAIHKSQKADHIRNIRDTRESCICTMQIRDCTNYQAQCRNSKCVAVDITAFDSSLSCNTDADCVLVRDCIDANNECCPRYTVRHKSQEDIYYRDLTCITDASSRCQTPACDNFEAQCHNSQCVMLKYGSAGEDPVLVPISGPFK